MNKPNTLIPYRNEETLEIVKLWFSTLYSEPKSAPLSILDLYQSYCEYTMKRELLWKRMDANAFAKCLVACKIMEIDGRWYVREGWTPMEYELRRATAYVSDREAQDFINKLGF